MKFPLICKHPITHTINCYANFSISQVQPSKPLLPDSSTIYSQEPYSMSLNRMSVAKQSKSLPGLIFHRGGACLLEYFQNVSDAPTLQWMKVDHTTIYKFFIYTECFLCL